MMKKAGILLSSVCSLVLLVTLPAHAFDVTSYLPDQADVLTSVPDVSEGFTGADLKKYLDSQSYTSDTAELGKILSDKYSGAWSNPGILMTIQFEDGTKKSVFDQKYEELTQQTAALQKNGTMDGAERDKQLGAAWKQIAAYNAADAYNKQKLVISTTYGIPMTEIDKLVKNLDTSGNSLIGYGAPGSSNLWNSIIGAAQTYDKLETSFKNAGIDANSASGKLFQNNSMLSLQTNTLYALGTNAVFQAAQWDKDTIEKDLAERAAACQSYVSNSGGASWKVPQSCAQADFGKFNSYTPDMMKNASSQFSTLFAQTEGLYNDTLGYITDEYDALKAELDQEYLDMKDKVAQGLASQADLDALMSTQKDLLGAYQEQLDIADFNYEKIQTDMMDTLSSKGITDSAFFTGDTSFSGKGGSMASFFGGSGGSGGGFLGSGSGGSMWQGSGGSGAAPWVLH